MKIRLSALEKPDEQLARFRRDVVHSDLRALLRRRLISGPAYVYPNYDGQYELCEAVGNLLSCHPAKVLIVGSAKLGFSIAPAKRYRAFGDKSDVDAVIVDDKLFDHIWGEVHQAVEDRVSWPSRRDFADYLMRGWIRPDMFPDVPGDFIGRWWDGFATMSKGAGIKVAGAVYRDWSFLEAYQLRALRDCRATELLSVSAAEPQAGPRREPVE